MANRAALRARARSRVDDVVAAAYLWPDDEFNLWLNEAGVQAAIRANLIRDSASSMTRLALKEGVATYKLNPLILDLAYAPRDLTTGREFDETPLDTLRACDPAWATRTGGQPYTYFKQPLPDFRLQLRIYPIPSADTTLQLDVYRRPIPMEADGDDCEIGEDFQEDLLDWVEHRAFGKRDRDTYDPKKADDALARFTSRFGVIPTPRQRVAVLENRRKTVRNRF